MRCLNGKEYQTGCECLSSWLCGWLRQLLLLAKTPEVRKRKCAVWQSMYVSYKRVTTLNGEATCRGVPCSKHIALKQRMRFSTFSYLFP